MSAGHESHVRSLAALANALTNNTEKIVGNLPTIFDGSYRFCAETEKMWAGSDDESESEDESESHDDDDHDGAREAASGLLAETVNDLHRAATDQGQVLQIGRAVFKSNVVYARITTSVRDLISTTERMKEEVSREAAASLLVPASPSLRSAHRAGKRLAECNSRLAAHAREWAEQQARDAPPPQQLPTATPFPPSALASPPPLSHPSVPVSPPAASVSAQPGATATPSVEARPHAVDKLNGTSFVEQAFRLMTDRGTPVGTLTWSITEVHRDISAASGVQQRPDSYTVRIRRGDNGSNVVELSCVPPTSSLVAAVHEALLAAATKLGVQDDYVLLKRSFDSESVPVENEPQKYIANFAKRLFGTLGFEDRPLGGGWCTTVKVCTFEDPLRKCGEESWVTLESVAASTKRVSRNEALLSLGKFNFTVEVLRMLEYGPAAQKAHAESILLTRPALLLPMGQQPETGTDSAAHPSVAEKILQSVPKATAELEMWLQQVYPGVRGRVQWDSAVMEKFRATLQCKGTPTFGVFVAEESRLPPGVAQEMPLIGPGPLNALYKTLRQIKETVDRAPLDERNRAREMPCV